MWPRGHAQGEIRERKRPLTAGIHINLDRVFLAAHVNEAVFCRLRRCPLRIRTAHEGDTMADEPVIVI